jgi:photosystem II stability/assembly factor-like uncharacterized protein
MVYADQYNLMYSTSGPENFESIKPSGLFGLIREFGVLDDGTWAFYSSGLYLSNDSGETWNRANDENIDASYMYIDGSVIYLMFRNIYRSTDGGSSFDTVFQGSEVLRKMVKFKGDFIISTTNKLYKSSDDGISWADINAIDYYGSSGTLQVSGDYLVANSSNRINSSLDGVNWTSIVMPKFIYRTSALLATESGKLLVGGEAGQIFEADGPEGEVAIIHGKLEEMQDIVKVGNNIYAFGLNGQLVYSEDGGDSWNEKKLSDNNLNMAELIESRVFVFDDQGTLSELNSDKELTSITEFPGSISNIVISEATGSAFLISNDNNGKLYKSSDGGSTWVEVYQFDVQLNNLRGSSNGDLYTYGDSGSLLRSEDDGVSWEQLVSPDENLYILDGLFQDKLNWVLLAGYNTFITSDGGQSYVSYQKPYNSLKLFMGLNDNIYALGSNSSDGWFYESSNGGESFNLVDETCSTISRETFFDESSNTVWFCGSGHTVEKIDLVASSTSNHHEITKSIVFPNPATNTLSFLNIEPEKVTIYDIVGRPIVDFTIQNKNVDISRLAKGTYFIKAIANGKIHTSQFVKM